MLSFALLAAFAPLVLASPSPLAARSMQLHETRETIPAGFVQSGAAPADQMLELQFGLVQNNPKGLEDALYSVSTPSSASYGQFLSKEEVEAFVAPTQETVDKVQAFLSANGLSSAPVSPAGDWIAVNMTVSQANDLFATQFSTFTHVSSGTNSVRTLEYSIPSDLAGHLDFVHPTITFPTQLSKKPLVMIPVPNSVKPTVNLTSDAVPASCDSVVTPACLEALYGIPTARATQSSNVLGVSGFIDQFANQADLRTFLGGLRPDLPATTTFTLQTLDGGQNTQTLADAGIEADLDTQYTIGVASGVPVTFISVGDNTRDGVFGFLDIINFLLGQSAPPHVLTTSYGSNEADVSRAVANNLCNAYAQLGARGTSILFSSGDGGVSGTQDGSCTTFVPSFPSGCPFLTSVGATQGVPETTATFSSGGFSNYFGIPSYQAADVASYLTKLGNTDSGRFNRSGRAFPDVSAQGVNVEIVFQNQAGLVDGTSCSSPIFASVIAMLNDELVAAGKSPLGFLNPFLYSTGASALADITTGSNPGCGTNGFPALAGWDPATGLGTPIFASLRTAVGL